MIRSVLLAIFALFGFSAVDSSAAEVRVAYKGVVTQANGPQAAFFAAGQQIKISYVVETTTADSNPSTSAGVYFSGLRELQISIEGAGVDVVTGNGTIQTFNDTGSDQVFFYSPNAIGALGGLPVNYAEVDFLDYQVGEDGKSSMISSDGIPTSHLLTTDISAIFGTSAGYTSLRILLEADEPVITCASEGYKGTQLTWCKNICENGLTGKVLDTWINRWVNRYRQLPYCAVDGPSNPS